MGIGSAADDRRPTTPGAVASAGSVHFASSSATTVCGWGVGGAHGPFCLFLYLGRGYPAKRAVSCSTKLPRKFIPGSMYVSNDDSDDNF